MAKTAHRPGQWKQSNKTHKTGQHRSKGAIRQSVSGKVGKSASIHSAKAHKKSTKASRKAQVDTKSKFRQDLGLKLCRVLI